MNILSLLQSISSPHSENEQLRRAKQLHNQILLDSDKINFESSNGYQFCSGLAIQIGGGTTQTQIELLNIVGIIAKQGADTSNKDAKNKFHETFIRTRMRQRIGVIIRREMKEEENQAKDGTDSIRSVSFQCLNHFAFDNDEQIQLKLFQDGRYIQSLTNQIATCGGSCEQNRRNINSAMKYFDNIFYTLFKKLQFANSPIVKEIKEQIIEEGALDEIEANLFNIETVYNNWYYSDPELYNSNPELAKLDMMNGYHQRPD
ncbi:MAG: hypothetical protein EZS28_025456 [Streblomastix strix]|uniref:Uncharacterized protein n=1 Tax=Streblomastix strix TaxID=222440 RepID=A0A5J4V924_9EUKA|nr:MAG: hypothetical protein EZS28_025456 [Streblomastix strix]